MKFSENTIIQIEEALRLHINYKGVPSGREYLKRMDSLAIGYDGPRGIALSNMLDDYFDQIGVRNLEEALERLRENEKT